MTNVSIEVTPADASWESACEMISQILQKNPQGYKLGFVVKDCFKVKKSAEASDRIFQINNQHAVGKNIFNLG